MGPGCCGPLVFAVRRRNRLVHAEVYWSGRRVGLLRGVCVDQAVLLRRMGGRSTQRVHRGVAGTTVASRPIPIARRSDIGSSPRLDSPDPGSRGLDRNAQERVDNVFGVPVATGITSPNLPR
jgi:hypothetical protein